MCFIRIGTNKKAIFHEVPNKDYNDINTKDILNIVHDIKGNDVKIFGWLEVDKNNNIIEDK